MKKTLCRVLAVYMLLFWPLQGCCAQITQADMDGWFEEMRVMVEEIGTREMGSEAIWLALEHLFEVYGEAGFSAKEGTLEEYWVEDSSNLAGVIPARNDDAPIVIVCAHFDSWSPGARDNASGLAAMLTLMKRFAAQQPYADTELHFIAFTGEELDRMGSSLYASMLDDAQCERILAVFNIDILAVDREASPETAFSCDTMGMRTENGYVDGKRKAPARNKTARAIEQAMEELGIAADEQHCVPRHMHMSDHESFHEIGVDAANICFRGTESAGGDWPEEMHKDTDVIGDFDLERTREALEILYTAIDGLASDHTYGD